MAGTAHPGNLLGSSDFFYIFNKSLASKHVHCACSLLKVNIRIVKQARASFRNAMFVQIWAMPKCIVSSPCSLMRPSEGKVFLTRSLMEKAAQKRVFRIILATNVKPPVNKSTEPSTCLTAVSSLGWVSPQKKTLVNVIYQSNEGHHYVQLVLAAIKQNESRIVLRRALRFCTL